MSMEVKNVYDIEVIMETQTPIRTGDAFRESKVLKPQSFLGSLRFWLEVICFVAGELENNCKSEKLDQEKFFSAINEIVEKQKVSIFEAKKKALSALNISIPSQVFGCNGWEGFVRVKEIRFCNKQINLPCVIYKEKYKQDGWVEKYPVVDNGRKKCPRINIKKQKEHAWYFPDTYLFGKASIKLELVDEKIGKNIIFPLLNFIQKYGFVGGSNNLGFGRVKFSLEDINISEFNQFEFNNKIITIDDIIEGKEDFNGLISYDLVKKRKIGFFNFGLYKPKKEKSLEKMYLGMIKTLLVKKSELRGKCRGDDEKDKKEDNVFDNEKRHFVFGSAARDEYIGIKGPNATKIIPWINNVTENKYEYGFISLILLEKFPRGRKSEF